MGMLMLELFFGVAFFFVMVVVGVGIKKNSTFLFSGIVMALIAVVAKLAWWMYEYHHYRFDLYVYWDTSFEYFLSRIDNIVLWLSFPFFIFLSFGAKFVVALIRKGKGKYMEQSDKKAKAKNLLD